MVRSYAAKKNHSGLCYDFTFNIALFSLELHHEGVHMRTSLKRKTEMLDAAFRELFASEKEIVSVFVVGSMYDMEMYADRRNNDYDIRILVNNVTGELLDKIRKFQKNLCEQLRDDEVFVDCSNMVGPVNHRISDKSYNLLLHLIIHTIDDLKSFLPLTHQRKYRKYHRILCGENYLTDLELSYEPEYLITCHEGINYCVDMLKRNQYKYLDWRATDGKVQFLYFEEDAPVDLKYEIVFYSVKNIILNLYEVLVIDKAGTETVEEFADLLAENESAKALMEAVLLRDEEALDGYGERLNASAAQALLYIRDKITKKEWTIQ